MTQLNIPESLPAWRQIFCNRTLNLRLIRAIGYDMDYTLIHYNIDAWERRAYEYLRDKLVALGWPVADLEFDQNAVIQGLLVDRELGNIVKANRFGYIKAACHGARMLEYQELRRTYKRTFIDTTEGRWRFLNTSFSISEGCMFRQLVDLLDQKKLPGVMGYSDLYQTVRGCLDATHMEGRLKAEIVADPSKFVVLDPDTPMALLDQKEAGKKLLLITNSGWPYTQAMMSYAFDPFLPGEMTWRELFDIAIVAARKPLFFSEPMPCFEVANEEGLLSPLDGRTLKKGFVYHGGNANLVESTLKLSGKDILYVGDHMYSDVRASKNVRRWRTALVMRELEDEIAAIESFKAQRADLNARMSRKIAMERQLSLLRLQSQRKRLNYGPQPEESAESLDERFQKLRAELVELDNTIAPLASASSLLVNGDWGPLTRAGNDKSFLARTLERHSDIYTSRVSNFLYRTPFSYIRAKRSPLPHDDNQ